MRHDAKLGLALGMLVIGFAIAFCFPRQADDVAWELEVPAPIADGELDFLPIRAYQPSPADAAAPAVAAELVEAEASGESVSAPAPEPIAPLTGKDPLAKLLDVEVPPEEPGSAAALPEPELKTHRVKAGDTLTGIAGRYLGSTTRYLEVYEANRGVLKSPDDLRIGLELVIPPKEASLVAKSPAGKAGSEAGAEEEPVPTLAERPGSRH